MMIFRSAVCAQDETELRLICIYAHDTKAEFIEMTFLAKFLNAKI